VKTISLKLPDGFDAQLAAFARKARTNESALIREAITIFLQQPAQRNDRSRADRARDPAGCLGAPPDSSSNRRRLRWYGRRRRAYFWTSDRSSLP
jgi:Arc/MetJ-type ribon-helix-helix transcriptional regulator